jgi:membrane-associated HD superfamily phosphohydrolase
LKTRDERTDYNKYFLSLLFISTLVAILTPLLTTTGIVALTRLVALLLVAILVAAIAISLVWALKLWVIWKVELSQRETLVIMEKALRLPFYVINGWTHVFNDSLSALDDELLDFNYYILPWIMIAVFVVILGIFCFCVLLGIIPLYNMVR